MVDPGLTRPPFIPDGTFMCCLCFEVFLVEHAWVDDAGDKWDVCRPCHEHEEALIQQRE